MKGRQRAGQGQSDPHLPQRHVWLASKQNPHFLVMSWQNHCFAARKAMSRRDIAGPAALLQELFDHPDGNLEALGDLLTSAFFAIVRSQNSFA